MATVDRLDEAIKSGSHGMSSPLGAPGGKTANIKMKRAKGTVKGPNRTNGSTWRA